MPAGQVRGDAGTCELPYMADSHVSSEHLQICDLVCWAIRA